MLKIDFNFTFPTPWFLKWSYLMSFFIQNVGAFPVSPMPVTSPARTGLLKYSWEEILEGARYCVLL
jgi:hypothetical protein